MSDRSFTQDSAPRFVQHPRCPYCRDAVQPEDPKAACDACMTWHHAECWEGLGRCAACQAERAVGRGESSPAAPLPTSAIGRREPAPPAQGLPRNATPPRERTPPPDPKAIAEPAPRERPLLPAPRGVHVREGAQGLEISWRWFSPMHLFMAFFCVFWDGFLVVWYAAATQVPFPMNLVVGCFPVIHVTVGLWLTYTTLCGFLNRTSVEVDAGQLRVRHGPLPWKTPPALDLEDVRQLYVTERVSTSKNGSSRSYDVHALLHEARPAGNTDVLLVKGLTEPATALLIEQRIEEHLGLVHQPVAGEYGA